jgi:23S rRNA (uracil1939-C5)-methyltransferase
LSSKLHKGLEVELAIDNMAYSGRGIARIDDKVIFVSGGLPGDRLVATITRKKKSYLEARAERIIESSPDRQDALCKHFETCGGCSFQSVPYERQLEYKKQFVYDALTRIGGVSDPPVSDVIPSGKQFYYRNKMEFSFLPMPDGTCRLGLHVRGKWSDVFDVEECLLQSETSNRIVRLVRRLVNELGIPGYHISRNDGFIRFLVVRESKATGKLLLNLVTNSGYLPELFSLTDAVKAEFPEVVGIYRTVNSTPANVAYGDTEEPLWVSEDLFETIGKYDFKIAPTTFMQTNSGQTEVLYREALCLADFDSTHRVLDLYCGCGTISHCISEYVNSVVGVEIDGRSVQLAKENAERNGVRNCHFVEADSARYLKDLEQSPKTFHRIVTDPPRAGMGNKVVRRLSRLDSPEIVYISCNPSTLARDLVQFREYGYRLAETVPVDMFPHTFHIETVNSFKKA